MRLAVARRVAGGVGNVLVAFKGGIENESLVGLIMWVLEVLNLNTFPYLLILFILCRQVPLVNPLLFCHSASTSCSTHLAWRYALDLGLLVIIRPLVVYLA